MSQPGDHSVRSLAEILREHGLETEFGTRPGRKRPEEARKADWPARPSPEDQPPSKLRPAADWPARPAPEDQPPSRLRPPPDPAVSGTPPRAPASPPRPVAGPATPSRAASAPGTPRVAAAQSAIPLAEILQKHGLETEFGTRPGRRQREEDSRAERSARTNPPRNTPGREVPARAAAARVSPAAPPAAAVPAPRPAPPAASPDVPMYGRRSTDAPLPPGLAPGSVPPSTGPSTAAIPALRPAGDADATGVHSRVSGPVPGAPLGDADGAGRTDGPAAAGPAGVLAWLRFAGELVVALAAGVGIYFAFTVLWELLPYAAVVAAPLTVTGLVAGVSVWRHRHGQAQLGVRLLAALLFAGTLLVIAPAAGLLSGS